DIRHFYELIPVDKDSMLWQKIDDLLFHVCGEPIEFYVKKLYYDAIKPHYKALNGQYLQNNVGIPYGSPLSGLISNLYLSDIDFKMSVIEDLFYARYADDILIAHPDHDTLVSAAHHLIQEIKNLGLDISKEKEKWQYFTNVGKKPFDDSFKGTSTLTYLGYI